METALYTVAMITVFSHPGEVPYMLCRKRYQKMRELLRNYSCPSVKNTESRSKLCDLATALLK